MIKTNPHNNQDAKNTPPMHENSLHQAFDPNNLHCHIVLVGMMGCGKSTIAMMLAKRLGFAFTDTDKAIEHQYNKTITELFSQLGEQAFRTLEEDIIEQILLEKPHIIAIGGGAFESAKTRALFKHSAITLWLQAPFYILWQRVRHKTHRPLLKTKNPKTTLKLLLRKRIINYQKADIIVRSLTSSKSQTYKKTIYQLKQYLYQNSNQAK